MTFTELLALIGTSLRSKGTPELAQRGPTRTAEIRDLLTKMAKQGPNERRSLLRSVRFYDEATPGWYVGERTLTGLDLDTLCLGVECNVDFTPQGGGHTYRLVYDPQGPLQVYNDASFADNRSARGSWVLAASMDAVEAGVPEFNNMNPAGYKGPDSQQQNASLVRQSIGGVTHFFTATQNMALADFPGGFPNPATDVAAIYWKEASPPSSAFQPAVRISYLALLNSYYDEYVPIAKLCQIYGRPSGGPTVYASFDENNSQFCENARVAGQAGTFRYDIVNDSATAVTGGPGGPAAWADITGKPSTFTPSAHAHPISQVTGLAAALETIRTTAALTAVRTADYTLALTDAGNIVPFSAAAICFVPPHSAVPFPVGTIIEIAQEGAGVVQVGGGAGVTVRTAAGTKTPGQWTSVGLRQRAVDEWVLTNGIA